MYALGTENEEGDETVHVTKSLSAITALCGFSPIRFVALGLEPGASLCTNCMTIIDQMETTPKIILEVRRTSGGS